MQAAADKVVLIDYTLTDDAGNVLDRSDEGEPLAYLHGAENIIPGLEQALEGKSAGDALQVSLAAGDAYGDHDPQLVQAVPRAQFPRDMEPEVGDQLQAETPDGPRIVTVVKVETEAVTIDANHPLAGVPLNFDVKVVEVRDATREELDHGHVHGPGGHEH
ncbi:MAG: peptidylprolyl isomerase [Planctomycetaceae bacterium]